MWMWNVTNWATIGLEWKYDVIYERLLCLQAEVLTTLENTLIKTAFIRKRTSVLSLWDHTVFFFSIPLRDIKLRTKVGGPLRFCSVPNNVGLEQIHLKYLKSFQICKARWKWGINISESTLQVQNIVYVFKTIWDYLKFVYKCRPKITNSLWNKMKWSI
jgi:hypothetical protein